MKAEQQKQAESLFFQTNLSKTEIAQTIGVSRRTLHYWVQQNNWDRIRESAQVMPTALAGNCYLILARLQDSILSPERADKPITLQEVNTMHRLTLTIGKLNKRGTLNENLEMMTYFIQLFAFLRYFDRKENGWGLRCGTVWEGMKGLLLCCPCPR